MQTAPLAAAVAREEGRGLDTMTRTENEAAEEAMVADTRQDGRSAAERDGVRADAELVADNADAALDAALALVREAAAAGRRACVVTASAELAASVRRSLAASGGALGVEALPGDWWLADRWELLGDGRRLVGAGERLALATAALDEALGLEATPGRVALLAALVAEDLPALVDEARRGGDLAPDELRVLDAAGRYAAMLVERGLAEPSEACVLLAAACGDSAAEGEGASSASAAGGVPAVPANAREGGCGSVSDGAGRPDSASSAGRPAMASPRVAGSGALAERVVALGFEEGDLTRPQVMLLRAVGARVVANARASARRAPRAPELAALLDALYRPDPAHPVAPTGAVRCAFATGATAEGRLIADAALALAREAAAAEPCVAVDALPSDPRAARDEGESPCCAVQGAAADGAQPGAGVRAGRREAAVPDALVAVAALDPEALFADYADELAACGVAVALEASVPLARTDAGRLLLALADVLAADEGRPAADAAADAALGAASGVWAGAAFRADRAWRRDRLMSAADVRVGLGELDADVLAEAVEDLGAGRLSRGVGVLAAALAARARSDGERALAAAALAPVAAAAPAAEEAGFSFSRLMALLGSRAVAVSLRVDPAESEVDAGEQPTSGEGGADLARRLSTVAAGTSERGACPAVAAGEEGAPSTANAAEAEARLAGVVGEENPAVAEAPPGAARPSGALPVVLFTTLERAGRLGAGAAYGLIVCGLNSAERPVRAAEDARATLLAKLGAAAPVDALASQRRRFRDALEAARAVVVLERALNGVGAEPRYPATLFEEAVDCYRADVRSDVGMNRDLAIPEALVPQVSTLAENRFVYGACGTDEQPAGLVAPLPRTGAIGEAMAPFITLPRGVESVTREGLDLSPSAIESYLDCPYRWFVQRRLSLDAPDEGFGSLERGTFVHEVLQSFYLRLREEGMERVTAEGRERALALIDEVFDAACAAQATRRPGHRYVPADRRERDLREALRPQLARYVAAEASFLPGFVPTYLEWSYGQDGGVPYAGHWIVGTVDRIDVDGEGRAVVIDYKTSLGPAYHLHGREEEPGAPFALPRKMQALIYARVVERLLGVRVVATLYVNPLRQAVAGAFDARSLDAAAMPGLDPARSRVPYGAVGSFPELLARAEEEVARRLAALAAGDVRPNPSDKDACRWCPAVICERRL